MAKMLDEQGRKAKADKIASVIRHFLGVSDLKGLSVLDVGCSGGIIANALSENGADVVGMDIDVPGLAKAQRSYGDVVSFVCADSSHMPIASQSVDVVICNHIYEHVVDPHALVREMTRVVKPSGMLYLGLGNRLGVMEPHYRLPFLSWLPRGLAHRYVRASGRADEYHEAFMTRAGLQRLFGGLHVWDYSYSVLAEPEVFAAGDVVRGLAARMPYPALRALRPILPTFIWVATTTPVRPAGAQLARPPAPVATPPVQA
jgi:ubiquinone/menaquinone biosynthesis C-methylase UbiE